MAILQDLEDEEYSELSSTTQAKGFLRLYAKFLGLSDRPEAQDAHESVETIQSTKLRDITPASEAPKAPSPVVVARVAQPESLPKESSEQPFTATETTDPTPEIVVSESQKDLQAIGRELVARRRYLNISWDLIEQETHIPREQLRNVERGDLDAFFNPTKYKSVLLSYTQFLNLDTTAIMIRYADAMQKRRLEKNVTKKRRLQGVKVLPPSLVNLKRFFTLDLFFGTLMILGIVGFLVWGISRMSFGDDSPEITATLPAVADILLAEITTETFEIIETPEPTQELIEVPTPTPFSPAQSKVQRLNLSFSSVKTPGFASSAMVKSSIRDVRHQGMSLPMPPTNPLNSRPEISPGLRSFSTKSLMTTAYKSSERQPVFGFLTKVSLNCQSSTQKPLKNHKFSGRV